MSFPTYNKVIVPNNVIGESEFLKINQLSILPWTSKTINLGTLNQISYYVKFFNYLIPGSESPKYLLFGGKQKEFTVQYYCI